MEERNIVNNMNIIKIRKSGTFYSVFDDDCYILYFLLGYQINNSKVGFPKSALNKVINILEENKINYEIIGEDRNKNFKTLNRYEKFVKSGREKYSKDSHYEDLIDKLKCTTPEKLDKILLTIETILNE